MTGWNDVLLRMKGKPAAAERPAAATASETFWSLFRKPQERSAGGVGHGDAGSAETARPPRWMEKRRQARPADDETLVMPSVEPAEIARELGLSRFASVRALQRLRREFAAKNHPDRVPSVLRGRATKRMMIANAMIDSAMKRFRMGLARPDRA